MADGVGAGAGGLVIADIDELLVGLGITWTDRVVRLVTEYKIVDDDGKYNRYCDQGIVPDQACRLLPAILVDERDVQFLAKFDVNLFSAMFDSGRRFFDDWDRARALLIIMMRKYFWRVDITTKQPKIIVAEYAIDAEHRYPQNGTVIFAHEEMTVQQFKKHPVFAACVIPKEIIVEEDAKGRVTFIWPKKDLSVCQWYLEDEGAFVFDTTREKIREVTQAQQNRHLQYNGRDDVLVPGCGIKAVERQGGTYELEDLFAYLDTTSRRNEGEYIAFRLRCSLPVPVLS